jgi:hypothetical protein
MNLFILLNIVSLVRTVFILLVIYFGFKLVVRYLLPRLVQKGVKNMQQKMYDQYRQQQNSHRREGEVTVENRRSKNTGSNPTKGEYVDFEEID